MGDKVFEQEPEPEIPEYAPEVKYDEGSIGGEIDGAEGMDEGSQVLENEELKEFLENRIETFEECVAAGYRVYGENPRKCAINETGELFVEVKK
jgi:hypothetical protein